MDIQLVKENEARSEPVDISREEWDSLVTKVNEIHQFVGEFARQFEKLGSAMGNPAMLLQMMTSGMKQAKKR